MKSVPRVLWVVLTGIVGLIALFLLTPSPRVETASLRPDTLRDRETPRVVRSSSGGPSRSGSDKTERDLSADSLETPTSEIAKGGAGTKIAETYNRLRERDLFRPLITTKKSGISVEENAIGVFPLSGIGGLPPLGKGDLFAIPKGPLVSQKTLGPWIYVGYSSANGAPTALVENKTDHQGQMVQAGDRLEDATVVSVSPQGVRFLKSDKGILLLITNPADLAKDAAKTGAKVAQGPSPNGNGSPSPPPQGGPPPSGPGPNGPSPGGPPPNVAVPMPNSVPMSAPPKEALMMRKG
jgi:hypothetical protein